MNEELAKIIKKYRDSPEFSSTVWNDVNARGLSGDTMLHAAVVRTDRADVAQLISLGADVNAIGDLGNTPLHEAASRGLVEIILKLVAAGAMTTSKNEFGQTPIDLARFMRSDKSLKNTLRALNGRSSRR
jgi:ankyrin repeat protein